MTRIPLPPLPQLPSLGAPALPKLSLYDQLAAPASLPQASAPKNPDDEKPALPVLTPEIEEGLLSKLGSASLSGLGWLGQSMSTLSGGRAIMGGLDTLTGGDVPMSELAGLVPVIGPAAHWLSDQFGVTDSSDTSSFRDVMTNVGAPENKPGFHPIADPLDATLDTIGLAGDVGFDPGTYASFGAGAVSKAGGLAKAAGKLPTTLSGRIGGTLRSVIEEGGDEAAEAIANAAKARGVDVTDDILNQPLGGWMGLGLPFQEPMTVLGTGPTALKAAQKFDAGLDWLGKTTPVAAIASKLDYTTHGARTSEVQPLARKLTEHMDVFEADMRGQFAEQAVKASADPTLTPKKLRQLGEDTLADVRHQMYEIDPVNGGQAYIDLIGKGGVEWQDWILPRITKWMDRQRKAGVDMRPFFDPTGHLYFPRHLSGDVGGSFNKSRKSFAIGFKGGTERLKDVIRDPNILKGTEDDATKYIVQAYGDDMVFKQKVAKDGAEVADELSELAGLENQEAKSRQLAQWIRRELTPEQRKAGGFADDPMREAERYAVAAEHRASLADLYAEVIAKNGIWGEVPVSATGKTGIKAERLAEELGMEWGNFKHNILGRMGKAGIKDADALKEMPIPYHVAEDLRRLRGKLDLDTSVDPVLGAADSFLALFKAGVLHWPARFVRDLTGATVLNAATGNFGIKTAKDILGVLYGKTPDLTDVPILKDMMLQRGLPATPENALGMLQELAYKYDVVGPVVGERGAGNVAGIGHAAMEQFRGTDPITADFFQVGKPFSVWGVLKKAFTRGANKERSANPLDTRGVMRKNKATKQYQVQSETKFAPAVAAQEAGAAVEFVNRMIPFVENLRRGVDPAEAKRIVDALQVNYNPKKFSKFEQETLLRLFPFYKWTSRMVPSLLKMLATHPGGGVAQLMRLTNAGEDQDFTPDYLKGSLAIPLGTDEEHGTQEYLTQLGLPIEALNTFHFGQGGLKKTGLDLLGMLNPLIKAPIEQFTGRQFYSDRDLRDLDPRTGRILNNVGLLDDPKQVPQIVDQALLNSPVARVASTVGTLTDPRKSLFDKLLNVGTGMRVSDVDLEKQKSIAARQAIEETLRGRPGVSTFENVYVKDPTQLTEEELLLYQLSKAMAARSRKKEK